MATAHWKRGRGKLGVLAPLLGDWVAEAQSPMGPVHCTRRFSSALGGGFVELAAEWQFSSPAPRASTEAASKRMGVSGGGYRERAFFGVRNGSALGFWSFTSDGKHSEGALTDVSDLHPQAVGFVAKMPAGMARQAYWPADDGGVVWVVESRTKKGWNRMVEHHYRRVAAAGESGDGDSAGSG